MTTESPRARTAGSGGASRRARGLRLRTVVVLAVLVPTIGMVGLAAVSAAEAQSRRSAAEQLDRDSSTMVGIVEARSALVDEETDSWVLAIGADFGASPEVLTQLFGVDFVGQLEQARTAVDDDPFLASVPQLAADLRQIAAVRADIDAGRAGFGAVRSAFGALIADVDTMWTAQFSAVSREVESDRLPGTVHARLDALWNAFVAMRSGSARAGLSIEAVLDGADRADPTELLAATYRYEAATAAFPSSLGPRAAAAWSAHREDPGTARFETTLADVVTTVLHGEESPLAGDPQAFGNAFVDGAAWGRGLADVVQSAGLDLRRTGDVVAADATRELRAQVAAATLLAVLSLTGAVVLARRVTRPVHRLERAAHQIHDGRFDLEPIAPSGPRELIDTATAFNDMATTLAAVEAHAVALADDPEAPVLSDELPGRTGMALQVALNRLRSSIQVAEQRRRELEVAATHDALTGLLNRAAAFEMIERDLARIERDGGAVMALFIDLDGLKPINDGHGHAAGDAALRMTADALRSATRSADIVARLGGDEFLVAGVVDEGGTEIEVTAERIRRHIGEQVVASDARIALHCSIGVAVAEAGTTVETLINNADDALYEAKRAGRDRVAWYASPRTPSGD